MNSPYFTSATCLKDIPKIKKSWWLWEKHHTVRLEVELLKWPTKQTNHHVSLCIFHHLFANKLKGKLLKLVLSVVIINNI